MASASLGHGGVGSSRTISESSSSVDRLGRGMLEMRLRDKVEREDDKTSVSTSFFIYMFILSVLIDMS